MVVRQLTPSPVLGVERYSNLEQFRPNDVIGGGVSKPLDPKNATAVRAVLPFPDSLLVLQRSFARRLETDLGAHHGLGMMIPLSFRATINGRIFDDSMIVLTRGKTPSTAVEDHPNTYLMLRFNSDMRNRGWADFKEGIVSVSTTPNQMERIRRVILEMFEFAAHVNSLDNVREQMHETLIAALDTVLQGVPASHPRRLQKYRRLVDDLDELTRSNPIDPLSSERVAGELQVSLRTLHTAVRAVHGMTFHQYVTSKRLWLVHRKLKTGAAGLSVRAAALANGFWHMSEFSRTYKVYMGELPSETLARAQKTLRFHAR